MEIIIKINGQDVPVNVSTEVYYKFLDRAKHKQENLAHEKRRHWDNREFNEYIILNEGHRPYYLTPEDIFCQKETLKEIMQVLELCSKKQRRRFLLYVLEGLSYSEIGKLENCSVCCFPNFLHKHGRGFLRIEIMRTRREILSNGFIVHRLSLR